MHQNVTGALNFSVNNRFMEMVEKMCLPTASGVKTLSSLEMRWDRTSLGNCRLNHRLLPSGHVAPPTENVFLRRP